MISRQCPECEQVWFSASTGLWQCPGCGTQLSVKNDLAFKSGVTKAFSDVISPHKGGKFGSSNF